MTTQTNQSTIRFDDHRGGLAYPFLPDDWQWQIVSQPLAEVTEALAAAPPAGPATPADS